MKQWFKQIRVFFNQTKLRNYSLGLWCHQGLMFLSMPHSIMLSFVCALQESVSPILCKFCNQIPLASKVKFSGSSQSLCWIPRLGNLVWALELS